MSKAAFHVPDMPTHIPIILMTFQGIIAGKTPCSESYRRTMPDSMVNLTVRKHKGKVLEHPFVDVDTGDARIVADFS